VTFGSRQPETPTVGDGHVTRVLIAAASESTRSWFAAFLPRTEALSIVGIVALDGDLTARLQELSPDVVVLEATHADGEDVAQIVERVGDPLVDIVILRNGDTRNDDQSDLIRAGVRAILAHQPTSTELEAVIRAVEAGFVVLEPGSLVPAMTMTSTELAAPPLTPREIEVLNALAEGHGNKQIAARLGISEHTVKTHLAAIFEKLEASNRTEAVMAGARLGLVLL
jgi:NarL family two-component system response regulator YdfI